MYLELADDGYDPTGGGGLPMTALAQGGKESPYLFVPGGMIPGLDQDTYVNEDQFDDLPEYEWEQIMAMLEPYQPEEMGIWPFSTKKTRARKKERRKIRQADKIKRIETRGKTGTGIGGLFKGITDTLFPAAPGPEVRPTTQAELDALKPPKTWLQKNWGWLAGGTAIVIGGTMLARRNR